MYYAVVAASVLIIVGLSIMNLFYKELILSAFGKESQEAFYAADAGAECALYYDLQLGRFSTSTPSAPLNCSGNNINSPATIQASPCGSGGDNPKGDGIWEFTVDQTSSCSRVTVSKLCKVSGDGTKYMINEIKSRGYNMACSATGPRKVERALKVTY